MGQYWAFVNVDSRQRTGFLGKLGEFFFSDETDDLMYLLAIPVCPLRTWSRDPVMAGTWAGNRVICLGDYARTWPEEKVSPNDLTPGQLSNVTNPMNIKEAYPMDRVWVLRNLTKKIFVRSNGIPTPGEDGTMSYGNHQGFIGEPGLGNVLLSRIAWSDDSSISMTYEDAEDISRGSWAADRFDVRGYDEVKEELARDGWLDHTRVEAKRLYGIWISERGDEGDFPEEPETVPESD
ncbi:hypothetical protein CPB84DRAFT_1776933 [Gymnopilus junonius]|uniref:Uncharacterized protein n=1 Tax=Gymnopilus junonius TaxID=109634 RepID=A0A9P5TPH7_GYMJU|nr:hypothetical protein CPB84DRAFT_1776933 [Gymnopilus junonius]